MNLALGTARGDPALIGQSMLRYFTALFLTAAVCAACSLIFGQQVATSQMVDVSEISAAAVLLPLAAGAAGALTLIQLQPTGSGTSVDTLPAALTASIQRRLRIQFNVMPLVDVTVVEPPRSAE